MKILSKEKSFKSLLNRINNRYGLGALEYFFASNWINPFLTLYLNLRSFPFRQAVKFPVWVYGRPRIFSLNGSMKIMGDIKTGMIQFNCTNLGPSNMGVQSEIINKGLIIFQGKGMIRTGNRVSVDLGAILEFGENFRIGDMCNFYCSSSIKIGKNVRIAHRIQIFDSNFHYLADYNKKIISSIQKSVMIGDNCWICNSSTVSPGAKIPDYTIVASNSLVNKDFSTIESPSIIGGIPARFIRSGFVLVNNSNIVREVNKFYLSSSRGVTYRFSEEITEKQLGRF